MTETPPELLAQLTERASQWTGFRTDAVLRPAVAELLTHRLRGFTVEQLSRSLAEDDPVLVHDVCQAVAVGETYFFRTPEQIAFALAELPYKSGDTVRIWSAGCATGEETYSLSAALRAQRPPIRFVELAKQGIYGRWSVRNREPVFPTFSALADGRFEILPEVRQHVTFLEHNLLDPPPAYGPFDVIFCRNVLVYFARDAAERALAHLESALAPGGILVFGSMDVASTPKQLRLWGPAELQTYARSDDPRVPRSETTAKPAPRSPPAPSPRSRPPLAIGLRPAPAPLQADLPAPAPAEPVALHLHALALIERADIDGADRMLRDLAAQRPDYLPALLERALLHLRSGEVLSGKHLMRDLLARTQQRADDEILAAPEPMTVAFVRASARAALEAP